MANEDDLGLLLEKLESPERRRFLRNGLVTLGGVAVATVDPDFEKHLAQLLSMTNPAGCAPPLVSHFGSQIEDKDSINARFYNRTPNIKRGYAQVQMGVNPRWPANFKQHQARTGLGVGGLSGIDYYASLDTEIASCAKGIGYGFATNDVSGIVILVYHGLGYLTMYSHVRNRFIRRGYEEVPRGAIIGSGGGAGSGAQGIPHTHLTTFGPAFTPYLRNVTLEPWTHLQYPLQHVIDGEQFSIDNSGQLPYVDKGDFKLDDIFWSVHEDAVKYSDDVLKGIATKKSLEMMERTESEKRVGVNHGVDVRLLYLWELINQGKSLLSKNDNDEIRAKLIEYMSTTPALTAPIKDDSKPELYKILREKPLYTWDMWLQGKR